MNKIRMLSIILPLLGGCSVDNQGSYLYGHRDISINNFAPIGDYGETLDPVEQVQAFFTTPWKWPEDYRRDLP